MVHLAIDIGATASWPHSWRIIQVDQYADWAQRVGVKMTPTLVTPRGRYAGNLPKSHVLFHLWHDSQP